MALAHVESRLYPQHYAQAAATAKPTAGVPYGATLYETDTGIWYIYTANGWVAENLPAIVAILAGAITVGTMAALVAGEAHIGEVAGNTLPVVVTPTIGAAAFTAGDFVGGKLTLLNAGRVATGSGIIQSLSIVDGAKQAVALRVYLFKADLVGTYADNAVESFTLADLLKLIDVIDVLTTDWETLSNASVTKAETLRGLGIPYKITTGTSLFAIIRTLGTPTYTANCLQLTFGLLRD